MAERSDERGGDTPGLPQIRRYRTCAAVPGLGKCDFFGGTSGEHLLQGEPVFAERARDRMPVMGCYEAVQCPVSGDARVDEQAIDKPI